MKKAQVAIVMGSDSDLEVMSEAAKVLDELDIPREISILSTHRAPEETASFTKTAQARGIKVIIAGAGGAAALAGSIASLTTLPVIGVPVNSKPLEGLDSLLSIVQMPPGVPVATVGINSAKNAAILALFIPTVATGTPGGIWTIERSESSPSSGLELTGTPITGRVVKEAIEPARAAAPPAPP